MPEYPAAPSPNWLRLLDLVEIAINNAHIADTELSPFYLNLGYHPQFFFDIPNLDEDRLRGEQTISIKEWMKKLRADWSFVFRALYHERERSEEMGNRKKANYQFKVGQDILINQRKHHRNQLGTLGRLHRKRWDRSRSRGRSLRTHLRLTSQPLCARDASGLPLERAQSL